MRFAAVISHPIQHYSPIFTRLAVHDGIEVKVFYLSDHGVKESYDPGFGTSFSWDISFAEGHDHVFVNEGMSHEQFRFFGMRSRDFLPMLEEFKPDMIWMHGYNYAVCWRVLQWAQGRSKILFFGDSELVHDRPLLTRLLKRPFVKWFFKRCDYFLTIGDNNEAYYRHYGVPDSKLIRAACPVDVQRFALSEPERDAARTAGREQFGIPPDAFVVLFSGKLIERKRPLDLLHAMSQLPEKTVGQVHALYIGTGDQTERLNALATELGLQEKVHMAGFINQSRLPAVMAVADTFLISSSMDPHPLVVSESLPLKLPVIASDKVGCVGPTDTARPDVNALVYPCGNIQNLADCIDRLASDTELYLRMRNESFRIAPSQDFDVTVNAILGIQNLSAGTKL